MACWFHSRVSGRPTAPARSKQERSAPVLTKSSRDAACFPILAHGKIKPAKYKSERERDGGGSVTDAAPQREAQVIARGKYASPLYLKSSHGSISISSIIVSDSAR